MPQGGGDGLNAQPANSIVSCCLAIIPQVSSSCTSVYIDGSETRGALNAEVKIKYGTFSGQVESLHASCIVLLANISQKQIVPFTSLQQLWAKCVHSFCHFDIRWTEMSQNSTVFISRHSLSFGCPRVRSPSVFPTPSSPQSNLGGLPPLQKSENIMMTCRMKWGQVRKETADKCCENLTSTERSKDAVVTTILQVGAIVGIKREARIGLLTPQ